MLGRGPDHLVTRDTGGRVTVLAWAPVDVRDWDASPATHTVTLSLPVPGASGSAFALRSSVHEEAGNPRAAWHAMGRPMSPRPEQIDRLRELAEPDRRPLSLPVVAGRVDLDLTLSRHEVTLVEISPVHDETPPWSDDRRLLGTWTGDVA